MRNLIDIPEKQIKALTALSQAEKVSHAEVIREAIAYYLEKKKPHSDHAIGLWKSNQKDALSVSVLAQT